MKVAERMRRYIDSKGMRINFVADMSGIPLKKFYSLINGKSRLTADEYEKICIEGLGLDPRYFFQKEFLEFKNGQAASSA